MKLKGPVKPMIQPVSLGELVRAVIDDSVEDAAEKDVRLMLHDPEAITLGADPRLLRSALSNLLRNAVKFTHAGGSVVVRVHQSGQGRVAIEVEDE